MSGSLRCRLDSTLARLREILDGVEDPLQDEWDPIEVGLLFARLEYEDLDLDAQRALFDGMVAQVEAGLPRDRSLHEQMKHVIRVFAGELHFEGDKTNYYNIKNSFLNDVFLRRKGIPISLSLVFMGLCRQVGIKALGISFPGHFLVRISASAGHFDVASQREGAEDWARQLYIDPFDGGAFLTVQDCERRLMEWTRGVVPFGPDALKVAHPREILSRMLRNLRAILMEKEDLARLYWVLTALIELCPADRSESYKDRGILLGRMGRYVQAAEDFRAFLAVCTDPPKRAHVERMLQIFENRTEQPN